MAEPTKPVDSSSSIEEWQLDEIRKGLQDAEAGNFASDEEVAEIFSKLRRDPSPG